MKFSSFARLFENGWLGKSHKNRKRTPARPPRPLNWGLESLEEREVPSALPPAIVGSQRTIGAGASPVLVTDPTSPQNMVIVALNGTSVVGQTTSNGGATWQGFTIATPAGFQIDQTTDPILPVASRRFTLAGNPSVAFDRGQNFYVTYTQSNAGNTSGVLVLQKFHFNVVGSPTAVGGTEILYRYSGVDPVLNPIVAIDTNLPLFADPETGETQTDTLANPTTHPLNPLQTVPRAVWVAWNTNTVAPTTPDLFTGAGNVLANRNAIRVVASGDGGETFSTPVDINDGGGGIVPAANAIGFATAQPATFPQIVFTQGQTPGTANPGGVAGGHMVTMWQTPGGAIRVDNSVPDDGVVSQILVATATFSQDANQTIIEAIDNGTVNNNPIPDTPSVTTSTLTLPATFIADNPTFDIVTDLNVRLALFHPHLNQLRIELSGADANGNALGTVMLLNNRTNGVGDAIPVPPLSPPRGVADQANMGELLFGTLQNNPRFTSPGALFDQQATLQINDPAVAAPYFGTFQPEEGRYNTGGLNIFNGLTAAQLAGSVWTLTITDTLNDASSNTANPPVQFLDTWDLQFTAHLTGDDDSTDRNFGIDRVVGGASAPTATNTAEPQGVGHAVIAVDNTLGSFSPYQGRLYVAYTSGSDVFVRASDNGGVSWNAIGFGGTVQVSDATSSDGFSTGNRPAFMPSITIDPTTGTLVVSYYDARYDAAQMRVATYLSASIDGGNTFSTGEFLNERKTAVDAITGETVVLEPIPSNQTNTDFGIHQAVAAYGGKVYAIWSGNVNAGGASLRTADVTIAGGARIVYGDMGPVAEDFVYVEEDDPDNPFNDVGPVTHNDTFATPATNPTAAPGTRRLSGFVVQFDRPIDPATFGTDDVTVVYRDTVTPPGTPGTPVQVASVTPLFPNNSYGPNEVTGLAKSFLVTFTNPQVGTGTYSYSVGPIIRDKIRSATAGNVAYQAEAVTPDFTDISLTGNVATPVDAEGTFGPEDEGQETLTAADLGGFAFPFFGTTFSNIGFTTNGLIVLLDPAAPGFPIFNHEFSNSDLSDDPPEPAIAVLWDDLIVDLTGSSQIYWQVLGAGPTQRLIIQWNDARRFGGSPPFTFQAVLFANGDIQFNYGAGVTTNNVVNSATVGIKAGGAVDAPRLVLSLNEPAGTFVGPNQSTRLSLAVTAGATVPGAFLDQNQNAILAEPTTATSTGDAFVIPAPLNGGPFRLPYDQDTQPLIIPGPHLNDTFVNGNPATSDNLVLNGTTSTINIVFDRDMDPTSLVGTFNAGSGPVARIVGPLGLNTRPYAITADPNPGFAREINGVLTTSPDPDVNHPRTYRLTFLKPGPIPGSLVPDEQFLSGSYTVVFNSTARAAVTNDLVDTNLNAGLDLLRGVNSTNTATVSKVYNSSGASNNVQLTPGTIAESTITIDDDFAIQGATVRINITYPFDPDLIATLVAPDLTSVRLFTQVGTPPPGSGASTANFTGTVFDDRATTPIQQGLAPFNLGTFNPQEPLSNLIGRSARGTWRLSITNTRTGEVLGQHTLDNWSLTFQQPESTTGLGEIVADQYSATFRVFTMDPTDPVSHNEWTAVGPAAINNSLMAGRVTGLAVDPSDPSGNTVFVGAASGGVWKTTNFLTTDPQGPTYVPLTDFGPTFSLNIGGIAVFPRDGDPNRSIVVVSTGEGDTGSTGVGFLISQDGGGTWTLLDSTQNVYMPGDTLPDGAGVGDELPIDSPLRDHKFVGTTSFKVVVDPNITTDGEVVIYAALSGTEGGVWVSYDTGKTWGVKTQENGATADTRIPQLAGDATDVVLSAGSRGTNGNLQIVYGAIRGSGVFFSQNQGASFFQTANGGSVPYQGNPLIIDGFDDSTIPVNNPSDSPNGAKGRIVLVTPFATGNPVHDFFYQSWIFAAVVTPGGSLDGLYTSKDFGTNWTKVRLTRVGITPNPPGIGTPTNDETLPFDINPQGGGGADFAQGNYAISLGIDPTNPNIVYLGGTAETNMNGGGMIRIDLTKVQDPHALVMFESNDNDGGLTLSQTTGSVTINPIPLPRLPYGVYEVDPITGDFSPPEADTPYLNLTRDPNNPFVTGSTIRLQGVNNWNNDGSDAYWTPFTGALEGSTDQHRMVSFIDPVTGHARLIFGNDWGVFTGVDRGDGTLVTSLGTNEVALGRRNGNLQISQLYGGSTQPSLLAASIAGALFYAGSHHNGSPQSDPEVLQNGDLNWISPTGFGTTAGTDQTGSGTVYQYKWPATIDSLTAFLTPLDFFTVTPPGAVERGNIGGGGASLIQFGTGQWPNINVALSDGRVIGQFTVNPINGRGIVISSAAGRVFRTTDGGLNWFVIGQPANLDGSYAQALAYGAPDISAGGSPGSLDNVIYAGTQAGNVFATFTGGGFQGSPNWKDISAGLDGSPVQKIVANPVRGTHDLYAVTSQGVYYMADSTALAPTWVDITGNLFDLTHDPFDNPNLRETLLKSLTALAVDWRKQTPDSEGVVHPEVYVGGVGGVFRITQQDFPTGTFTWEAFPSATAPAGDQSAGTVRNGGLLPNVIVTQLELSLGNINPATGRPDQSTGPNVLVATTFGRGNYAIRLDTGLAPGPRVQSLEATNPNTGSISSMTVTFFGTVDPSIFDKSKIISLKAPDGTDLTSTITAVTDITPASAPLSIVSLTSSNGTATATVASTGGLVNGALVAIAGANQAVFNGNFIIRVLDGTRFQYQLPTTAPANATGSNITVTPFNQHNVYRIDFAPQTAEGVYTLKLGPNITDFAGNKMDQNQNGVGGELPAPGKFSDDTFTGYVYKNTGAVPPPDNTSTNGPFVPTVIGTASQLGITFALISNGSSFTTAGWSDFLGTRPDLAPHLVNNLSGDFNGDGKADVALRFAPPGQQSEWWVGVSNGNSFTFSLWAKWSAGVWVDVLAGDFDGTGRDSITGRFAAAANGNPGGADAVFVARSIGTAFVTTFWGFWSSLPWQDVRVGDFNRDGRDDLVGGIILTGPVDTNGDSIPDTNITFRDIFVAESNGSSFTQKYWQSWASSITWTDVLVGDFDADGKSDLVARVKENGAVFVSINYTPAAVRGFGGQKFWQQWSTGVNWLNVQVGDYDGDGRSDVLAVAGLPGTAVDGMMFVSDDFDPARNYLPGANPDGQELWLQRPGAAADWVNVISADFTGDGKSDVAMRYLPTGQWFVARSVGTMFAYENWLAVWGAPFTWVNVIGGSHL